VSTPPPPTPTPPTPGVTHKLSCTSYWRAKND